VALTFHFLIVFLKCYYAVASLGRGAGRPGGHPSGVTPDLKCVFVAEFRKNTG